MKIEFESISPNLDAPFRLTRGTRLARHNVLTLDRNGAEPRPDSTEKAA